MAWVPTPEGSIPANDVLLANLAPEAGESATGFITADDIATIAQGVMSRVHYAQVDADTAQTAAAAAQTTATGAQTTASAAQVTADAACRMIVTSGAQSDPDPAVYDLWIKLA